ncbi:glycosyltransferase [Flammeovirga aprica]|uniref:Glycosyltransferase family 1 protein n=1 Tax=Flammeovirga aprica JL-4 TaxID=694437 RepID=A0A7X9RS35_9BACT|nr:glycosyltransferase [Flammeovirga aprica]NME66795.1 glycosyltransferase family 1 protein [Flammeovirga aprica JL-4]
MMTVNNSKPKKIAIKMFPQESHINAILAFAKELKELGNEVIFVGTSKISSIITENGLKFHEIPYDIVRLQTYSKSTTKRKKNINDRLKTIKLFWNDRNHIKRIKNNIENEDFLTPIFQKLAPDLVLIDMVYTIYIPPLIKSKMKFAIVQTTTSGVKTRTTLPLSSYFIPDIKSKTSEFLVQYEWFKHKLRHKIEDFMYGGSLESSIIKYLKKNNLVDQAGIDYERNRLVGFKKIPEINTTFLEFDFPHEKRYNHYYVAKPVLEKRNNLLYDFSYEQLLREKKEQNKKIVFCSFGTAVFRYKNNEVIYESIIEVFKQLDYCVLYICIEDDNLRNELRENVQGYDIHIFKRLPQIELLKSGVDIMIGHGGMNSINECILTCTPMLIYPGSRDMDQVGNSSKVFYHGLGLRGKYFDSKKKIISQIEELLSNGKYKHNLSKMYNAINNSHNYLSAQEVLEELYK